MATPDLASSLLAQSRNRASTLKAEEEVARLYACAHLACDRLKVALDLPPIEPRPPIPPRIYKRLYNHLDKILPASASNPGRHTPSGTPLGSGRIRTPSAKVREQQQQQQQLLNGSPLASKSRTTTPSKERSLSDLRARAAAAAAAATPSKDRTLSSAGGGGRGGGGSSKQRRDDALPPWIRPALRYLLTKLGPAHIGPVVASGLESVVAPHGRLTDDAWVRAHLVAVLGALYLFVWRGVVWPAGREVDRERYVRMRKEVAYWLGRAREEVVVAVAVVPSSGDDADDDDAGAWEGWEEPSVREFDAAAVRGARHGWFDMDWVDGVRDLADREEEDKRRRAEGGDDGGEGGEVVVVTTQIRRPDTMFQERYDYLSERKRKAYAEWKEGLLKRIKELEAR
ncbi:origin recognition complex, subunit 6 [Thermothelomyces heterothallicus CBS 202.75]|uniref:origin recognition complex, subunit 6 n=1 Tax=Thermothelomyces heterothallicus CBS 202.75 TaxID=1149848 RepID=UPI0037449964